MRAVDTNLLVRIIIRDNIGQAKAADAFIAGGAWVSILALAEVIWVLGTVHALGPAELATAVEILLDHKDLALQDSEAVADLEDQEEILDLERCTRLSVLNVRRNVKFHSSLQKESQFTAENVMLKESHNSS